MEKLNPHKYDVAKAAVEKLKEHVFSGKWRGTFHDECFTEKFVEIARKSSFFVDGGAEFGFYAWLALKYMPPEGRRIVLFEPEPERYVALSQAMEAFPEVTVSPLALAERRKKVMVYKETAGHSCTMDGHLSQSIQFHPSEEFEVETVALDDYFSNEIEDIDLVKMDIEGAEVFALQGMDAILKASRAKLFLEFHGAYVESIQPGGVKQIQEIFKKNSYTGYYYEGLSCVPAGLERGRIFLEPMRSLNG